MAFVETDSNGEVLTVRFSGTTMLDAGAIEQIQNELLTILAKTEEPNVLLDFRTVKFLSSAALAMVVKIHRRCGQSERNLVLCGLAPNAREAFQITGLDKILKICKDCDEAGKTFPTKDRTWRAMRKPG